MGFRSHKYGAKAVTIGGQRYASKGEGSRALFLRDAERRGELTNLRQQVKFTLAETIYGERTNAKGKTVRGDLLLHGIAYVADFVYTLPSGLTVVEDYKGYETPEFQIKERLLHDMLGITLYKPRRPAAPLGPGQELANL